ncbi:MAG: hypothetical protein KBT46_08160 [Ruminococcus sp.]|nr:hypothetical protein [Candidatus Copronaster equi]
MFVTFFNKIISVILVPIFMCQISPVFLIKKLVNKPKEMIQISDQFDEHVNFTAHRGTWSIAPENTLPAYEKAVELGYYSAECDIRLTSDNVWVLSHGSDINKRFWQIGNVEETDFETIRTYTYKNGPNFWEYKDMQIPTLDEYLDVFVGSSTRPQIEIKTENYDLLYTVVDAIKAKGLEKSAIIISFDLKQLQVIRELDKDVELWYLVDYISDKEIEDAKSINGWLSANFEKNDENSIKNVIASGVGVSFWTVNTPEDAKMLYDLGVRYIETDILF